MIRALRSLFTPKPSMASAGRALANLRHERNRTAERKRRIDLHNTMAAKLGRAPIDWRDA